MGAELAYMAPFGLEHQDAQGMGRFVDGHVSYVKVYWNGMDGVDGFPFFTSRGLPITITNGRRTKADGLSSPAFQKIGRLFKVSLPAGEGRG